MKPKDEPPPGVAHNLLRLFFKHPFPVFPLADREGQIIGVVRRTELEALLNRNPGVAEETEFLHTCRLNRFSRSELELVVDRLHGADQTLPLVTLSGQVIAYWGKQHESFTRWAQSLAGNRWPLLVEFDRHGLISRTSTAPTPRWAKILAQVRTRHIGTLAFRLGTAYREAITSGYFQKEKERYTFSFSCNPDGSGWCTIAPLVPSGRLIKYLRRDRRTLPELMEYIESELLRFILAEGYDRAAAAEILGVPRQTLHYKLKKYRLQ